MNSRRRKPRLSEFGRAEGQQRNGPLSSAETPKVSFRKKRRLSTRVQGNKEKAAQILQAVSSVPVNVDLLRQLSISHGGFLNNDLRRQAWPKLLGIDMETVYPKPSLETLQNHRDYNQVLLDVKRTLKRFPPDMEMAERMDMQDQLVELILRVLVRHPDLYYYQGFHDICVTFLLVVGEDVAAALIDKLCSVHLRDFMAATMDKTLLMLQYLFPIVGQASPELRNFLEKSELRPIFCTSWLLTWFGHVLNRLNHIVRLYDFFISCHQLMPIYLAAAIVLHRENEILASECDMCTLHCLLSKIPDDLPIEQLISSASNLFILYPPAVVSAEAQRCFNDSMAGNQINAKIREERKAKLKKSTQRKRNQFCFAAFIGILSIFVALLLYPSIQKSWR